jgi:hypothetical protein
MPESPRNRGLIAPIIKIAIVEDLRTLRDGYRALIDGTEGYACTGTYRTMEEALDQIGHATRRGPGGHRPAGHEWNRRH